MVPRDLLDGFFSRDLDRVLAAVAAMESDPSWSSGRVEVVDIPHRDRDAELRYDPRGPFSERIFGADAAQRAERLGHIDVVGVVHPAVFSQLRDDLEAYDFSLQDVAEGKRPLPGTEDAIGPAAIRNALRAKDRAHRLLPLCSLQRIPVPPLAARPFVCELAPTMVDPWIGPINEALNALVYHAARQCRLGELDTPDILMNNESTLVQGHFDAFMQLAFVEPPLVPPLAGTPPLDDERALGIAFVRDDLLVVQRADAVYLVTDERRLVVKLPPCACRLAGTYGNRFALFYEFLIHPMLAGGDLGYWGSFVNMIDETVHVAEHIGEMSAIDTERGAYLTRATGLPRLAVHNDEPEQLYFVDARTGIPRRLQVGGDRPRVLAYANGMEHALVGELGSGTQILHLPTGVPHAYPAEPRFEEFDNEDEGSSTAVAIAFRDGAWQILWPGGIVADHLGRDVRKLDEPPAAAAFDREGRRLAVMLESDVAILDAGGRMLRRFAVGT